MSIIDHHIIAQDIIYQDRRYQLGPEISENNLQEERYTKLVTFNPLTS
jgi:hypothetical protein